MESYFLRSLKLSLKFKSPPSKKGKVQVAENKEYTKNMRIPALKALGELTGSEWREHHDICILSGVVPAVLKMLKHIDHPQARKEGCWLVSNLLAANPDQVGWI